MAGLFRRRWFSAVAACCGLLAAATFARSAAAAELVMYESATCAWCKKWDTEIAPVYANAGEARCAPLRRVDIHQAPASSAAVTAPVIYTPTFVLVDDGREIGRVTGYAGEDFFWSLLQEQLAKLPGGCPQS